MCLFTLNAIRLQFSAPSPLPSFSLKLPALVKIPSPSFLQPAALYQSNLPQILSLVLMNTIRACFITLGELICLHKLQMKGYYLIQLGLYPMVALKINREALELHQMLIRIEHILQSIEHTDAGEVRLLSGLMVHCVNVCFLL